MEDTIFLLCRNHLKLLDAPGASPRRWGAPVAIVLYYLFKNAESFGRVIPRHRMRPRPRWGQGWRKGGQLNHMKQVFYRADLLSSLGRLSLISKPFNDGENDYSISISES